MSNAETLIIEKDIDGKEGAVEHSTDVLVKGNVRSGQTVTAKGTITVEENVEDATIEAGFNVIVAKEFAGTGKGIIRAKGTVEIGSILNQKVSCNGDVTIKSKAIDGTISSKGTVRILGAEPGALCGGTVSGLKGVAVSNAGNEKGAKTVIEAGNKEAFAQVAATQIKLHAINKEKNVVENQLNELKRLRKINIAKYSTQIGTMERLMEQLTELNAKAADLSRIINENKALCLLAASANVVVSGDIYPGVTVSINDANHPVAHKFSKCFFLYDKGKIVIKGIR